MALPANSEDKLNQALDKIAEKFPAVSGSFLYSSARTVSKGHYYLLGYNPGGDPKEIDVSVADHALSWKDRTENAYCDEVWGRYAKGEAPYQKGVRAICESIGVCVRNVCASNWYFVRTQKAAELKLSQADFYPVHEAMIEIIQPKVIFAIGLSTFEVVKHQFGFSFSGNEQKDQFSSGHGDWQCYVAKRSFEDKTQKLIGLPHLSRYAVQYHEEVLSWIRGQCIESKG